LIKSIQDQDFQGFSPDDVLKAATSWNIAKLWAAVGDFAAALKVANLIRENQGTSGMKSASLSEVAEFQANAGDIAGALSTSAAALKIADKIHDDRMPYLKSLAQRSIAEAQVKAGDIAGAQNTLAAALKNANQIREADRRSATQTAIAVVTAEAQVKAGDITGAQSTLAAALKTANQIRVVDDERWTAQTAVAEAQVKAGDIAGAQSALAAALKSADQILGDYSKRDAQVNIALVRPIVPIITAADWLNKLDDTAALNSDPFMDLAGYVRARTKPDEPLSPELVLTDTANAIVKAQNLIDGMLKQQAKQQARP
jgi:tetratricopeptide (TPR) repeat protein